MRGKHDGRDAVIRDDAEAAMWYRRAAEQGNTDAQIFLGHMYANGRGVPQDDAEAVRRYRRRGRAGEPQRTGQPRAHVRERPGRRAGRG